MCVCEFVHMNVYVCMYMSEQPTILRSGEVLDGRQDGLTHIFLVPTLSL